MWFLFVSKLGRSHSRISRPTQNLFFRMVKKYVEISSCKFMQKKTTQFEKFSLFLCRLSTYRTALLYGVCKLNHTFISIFVCLLIKSTNSSTFYYPRMSFNKCHFEGKQNGAKTKRKLINKSNKTSNINRWLHCVCGKHVTFCCFCTAVVSLSICIKQMHFWRVQPLCTETKIEIKKKPKYSL